MRRVYGAVRVCSSGRPTRSLTNSPSTNSGGVTPAFVAAVYALDEEDAGIIIEWVKKACIMRDEVGYNGVGSLV